MLDLPEEYLQDPQRLRAPDSGRDGCRVPLPWTKTRPFGFAPPGADAPWLPMPDSWAELSVEAQEQDPGSALHLYRAALRLRRELPGLGGGPLTWLDSPEGSLAFARGDGFVCTVNMSDRPLEPAVDGELLLASAPLVAGDGVARLAADSAAWWRVR
ncbi:hypothetical protein GCM10010486_73830 [Nonomuraea roseoviolacea subsp. carminata]|uniref:Glycosidase n=1 Tax=Nonomuraea roseoviolacea subsp. carminata TaxID=160689 RepID=A0ABT1KFM8_9ACTN|nr:glycosidase [Nonomuraea roseoviolacea subsp. carminata]